MNEHLRPRPANLDPTSRSFVEAFGATLLSSGLLDAPSLARAQRAAETAGDRFDQVLTKLGILSERDLAAGLAQHLEMPLYHRGEEPLQVLFADKLPLPFIVQNKLLPVRVDGNTVTIAVVDPLDQVPLESVRFVIDQKVRFEIITPAEFERAVQSLFGDRDTVEARSEPVHAAADAREHDLQQLRDSASEAPVIRLVQQIMAKAVDSRASDIYVEPTRGELAVRYRVDGLLRPAEQIPSRLGAAVISRMKILAKLDIAERRIPQDGRINLAIRGDDIDFRVATMPTMDGETITMRVLDRSRVDLEFPRLGFSETQIVSLQRLMDQPNGVILVTGPTGSGKTTTLYTMLKHLNNPAVKIFTVEDPIEYQLPGLSQVQVQEAIGLDFPACLRAILRHHPNMIMIGEIRDSETARIAVQSSLTGHLVLSTVHTNSAAETVTRLVDMGIEHFLLGSTLRGIMGQRLVRRLCPSCAQPHADLEAWVARLAKLRPALCESGPPRILQRRGCVKCQSSGFVGQMSIAEIMIVDDDVRHAILQRVPAAEIERLVRDKGGESMHDDGLGKVWQGLTTVEEVIRVTGFL